MNKRTSGFVALLLIGSGALALGACKGRSRSGAGQPALAGSGHLAIVDLRGGAAESGEGGFFPLPATQTYTGLIRGLERVAKDEAVAGVFVRLGGQTFGFARALELGESFKAIKKAKKRVTCHTHQIDNGTAALLLSGCDDVWLSAAGDVGTVGIAAQVTYLKGAMDRLGIQADMLAMGRYKSGAEALTREGPSDASAQNLTEALGDLRKVWLAGATAEHASRRAGLEAALEDGPYTPNKAKDLGLVTHIGFEDEAMASAKKAAGTEKSQVVFGPGSMQAKGAGIAELVRGLTGADERTGGRPHVAVVPLVGSITVSAGGPFGASGITSDAAVKTIKRLREDDSVAALVVRIDSPGGSPLASDLIWHQLMLTRKEKPVIVSIGGMAASGGYYIACAADKIVAAESAIVGSIGVFGGKIVIGGALEKFGITSHTFPANPEPGKGARALYLSPLTPWDDATRERVRESMQRIYDLFVERVAEGRKMPKEKIYATAEGAIFLAQTGKARGLVDEIGGLTRAIALARQAAKLGEAAPVTVEGSGESFLDALLLGSGADDDEIEAAWLRFERRRADAQARFPDQAVLEQLRPFAAVVGPLLAGESVVAALPYAITVR